MMAIARDAITLKLHTDAATGVIWYADGNKAPVNSNATVAPFVDGLAEAKARSDMRVRVIGTHANAELITRLHRHCQPPGRLEVASPLICGAAATLAKPSETLHAMRLCQLPPSLGGWHTVTERDYPAYALIEQLKKSSEWSDHTAALLRHHPAWHSLQWITGVCPRAAMWLLSMLIDPRWFIDINAPDRLSRMHAYMGLTPSVVHKAIQPGNVADMLESRCLITLGVWHNCQPPEDESEWLDPGNFLWRVFRATGGGEAGLLRASHKLIAYLKHTWLQALYPDVELFVPEMFFKNSMEIEAYKAHYANRAGTV